MQAGIQHYADLLALLPREKEEIDVLFDFLRLSPEQRRQLLQDEGPVDQPIVYHQMRQIFTWFQNNSLEWKNVPHNVQQELASAVKRRELEPADWKQRMEAAFQSYVVIGDANVQQRQRSKLLKDLDVRIEQKKDLASILTKHPSPTPEQPTKRQRRPSDNAYINASIAVLRVLYCSCTKSLKMLDVHEGDPLLVHEEHFITLLMQMNALLDEAKFVVEAVAELLVNDKKFDEFDRELSALEGASLYRRLRTVERVIDEHQNAKSAEN